MRAIVVHSLGDPEVLTPGSRPIPVPGPAEVLVRVHAAGVNFSDTERRRGVYDAPTLPWTPGNEGAGTVERVGPGVDPTWLGRRVAFWAMRTSGTYAEYTVTPASSLFRLRDDLDFTAGAALPVNGLTAYGLSHFATALAPGQTALVHAAAGGVGGLLVQLLCRRGVSVFGTASTPAKQELVRQYGALPLPYGPGLPELVRDANGGLGVNAVFDAVGRATQADSLAVLALYGQLVFFGEASGPPTPIAPDALYDRNLRVSSFWLAADPPERWREPYRELQEWVASGALRLSVAEELPLQLAAEAHRRLERRQTHGKVILDVGLANPAGDPESGT